MDIFKDNGNNGKTSKKKNNDKTAVKDVVLLNESVYAGIGVKVDLMNKLRKKLKSVGEDLKGISIDVNKIVRETFIELYKSKGENPKTFTIQCENGTSFDVMPADAYGSVTKDDYSALIKEYGKTIATKETGFIFNNKVLEKNKDAIKKLIGECEDISDEDKENLLIRRDSYAITKGTIDKLMDFKTGGKKANIKKVFDAVKPTVQIKF